MWRLVGLIALGVRCLSGFVYTDSMETPREAFADFPATGFDLPLCSRALVSSDCDAGGSSGSEVYGVGLDEYFLPASAA